MLPAQLIVDVFSCLADLLIVVFFIIELRDSFAHAREERIRHKEAKEQSKKMIEVLEALHKVLAAKAEQEIEVLEDVHAELSEINDQQQEMLSEEPDATPA
jgi:hypothetical protein